MNLPLIGLILTYLLSHNAGFKGKWTDFNRVTFMAYFKTSASSMNKGFSVKIVLDTGMFLNNLGY